MGLWLIAVLAIFGRAGIVSAIVDVTLRLVIG